MPRREVCKILSVVLGNGVMRPSPVAMALPRTVTAQETRALEIQLLGFVLGAARISPKWI